jgi:hypothetical protein
MPQVSKLIDRFCIWAIWLALKLRIILIGPLPTNGNDGRGGITQFIQVVLQYRPLLYRMAIAIMACGLLEWLGWRLAANLAALAAEIYLSLLAVRWVADAPRVRHYSRIVAAMWLPITVIAAAIYLLLFNDQGRELSVGLMDPYQKGFVFLGLALVYWALNNWLSARVGLDRSFRKPEKEQALLFWGPRLVGVGAHFLAAISLSLAAWNQPDTESAIKWWPILAAPLAIVLATIFAWLLDKGFVSYRYPRDEQLSARKWTYVTGVLEFLILSGLVVSSLRDNQPGLSSATVYIAASALVFLILISVLRNKVPLGKDAPSEARKQDEKFERNVTIFCTLVLAVPMLVAGAAVWNWPMQIGRMFGSLTIACFSFGALLALINLLDLSISGLARYARGAGYKVAPRAVTAVLVCVLVFSAIVASFTHTFHGVRLCNGECSAAKASKDWAAVGSPSERPDVASAARAWYVQAERAYHSVRPKEEPVPLFIVATAGGGLRAAYWTATILEALETDFSRENLGPPERNIPTENLMRNLLFAISGVSGGSIGAAAYTASLHDHEVNGTKVQPTRYLREDFLAPGLAAMVFSDGPANVLPYFRPIDRGEALERGLEYASRTKNDKEGLLSHKFLSFFPSIRQDSVLHPWRPALLLNATHLETGRRIITSHLKIERDVFVDSYDALQVLNSDVRLSTAAHNSSRFTYLSPAGNLKSATTRRHNRGHVIDGGYFENYGALTALELARKAIDAIDPDYGKPDHQNKIKLVILQISSDPTLREDRTLVRARRERNGCTISIFGPTTANPDSSDQANYLKLIDPKGGSENEGAGYGFGPVNELSAPLVGIMSVRRSHGTIAAAELAASICQGEGKVEEALQDATKRKATANPSDSIPIAPSGRNDSPQFVHLAMCDVSPDGKPGINPPLGLVLSDRTRSKFGDILGDCGNPGELGALKKALGLPPHSEITMNSAKDAAR